MVTQVTSCPCCSQHNTLTEFETTSDLDGRTVQLRICTYCSAIVNYTELLIAASSHNYARHQGQLSSEDFYGTTTPDMELISSEIINYDQMLDFLESRCCSFSKLSILDFGFGKGTFMLAAAKRFAKVIGVDFNLRTFQAIYTAIKDPPPIQTFDTLDALQEQIDVVFAWHTFEHLTDLSGVLSRLRRLISPNGWLIAQVPLFRPAYLCKTHFIFLNRRSLDVGLQRAGYRVEEVLFDITNSFMTVLARPTPLIRQ